MMHRGLHTGRTKWENLTYLFVNIPKRTCRNRGFSTSFFSRLPRVTIPKLRTNPNFCPCKRNIRGSYGSRPATELRRNDQQSENESVEIKTEKSPTTFKSRVSEKPSWEKYEGAASNSRKVREMMRNSTDFSENGPDLPQDSWATPTYPRDVYRRMQSSRAIRPSVDPKETSIILFPGQGVQYVGMGKNLLEYPNVRRIYEISSEILGYDLLDICLYGPKGKLSQTAICQPAIVATSLAALEKLKDESPHIVASTVATAGFSVGEITALIFSGAFSFADGMKLVRIRAEAMQGASEMEAGGMLTVFYGADGRIGYACQAALEWCRRKGLHDPQCSVANYLYPGCKVIAGNEEALKFIALNAKEFGIRRMKRLSVSGAFHTKLMLPAVDSFQTALDSIAVNEPSISVHSNVDGRRYRDARHIKRRLPMQICSPVKWEQTLHALYERDVGTSFPRTYECGPGRSLKAILEKVNSKAGDHAVCIDLDTVE